MLLHCCSLEMVTLLCTYLYEQFKDCLSRVSENVNKTTTTTQLGSKGRKSKGGGGGGGSKDEDQNLVIVRDQVKKVATGLFGYEFNI
jgi:hypothetical protein